MADFLILPSSRPNFAAREFPFDLGAEIAQNSAKLFVSHVSHTPGFWPKFLELSRVKKTPCAFLDDQIREIFNKVSQAFVCGGGGGLVCLKGQQMIAVFPFCYTQQF